MVRMHVAAGAAALALTVACGGGDSGTSPTPAPTPTPVPSASITASGNGALVIHPSATPGWWYKLYTPITIRETAGGSADWGYARLQLWRNGVEVERGEIGADILASPPSWTDISPSQNNSYALIFGLNTDNFDNVTLTLGFSDKKDGRLFTANVPFESFTDVQISLEPLAREAQSVHRLD